MTPLRLGQSLSGILVDEEGGGGQSCRVFGFKNGTLVVRRAAILVGWLRPAPLANSRLRLDRINWSHQIWRENARPLGYSPPPNLHPASIWPRCDTRTSASLDGEEKLSPGRLPLKVIKAGCSLHFYCLSA